MDNQEPQTIKLVVVGDGSVGKTCILLRQQIALTKYDIIPVIPQISFRLIMFPQFLITILLKYRWMIKWSTLVYGKLTLVVNFYVFFRDTAGQETYNRLRTLSYGQADIFLIIFSVVENSSFENALNKWYPELNQEELKKVPKIFVGNKIDMRNDSDSNHIRTEAATQLISAQNAKYFECSALTQEGLKTLFDEAIRVALMAKQNQNQGGSQDQNKPQGQKEEKACCKVM